MRPLSASRSSRADVSTWIAPTVDGVGVRAPPVVALAQPPVLVEVRDVADLGMRQSAPAPLGGCPADLERAEIAGEVAQLRVV